MIALKLKPSLAPRMTEPVTAIDSLSEVFPAAAMDPAALGFIITQLRHVRAPILWVQDRLSRKEAGQISVASLRVSRPMIMVDVSRAVDVLWAMEDGLRCKSLGAVIGEVWGDAPAVNFTATKRLAIRAEASGVPCWLVRRSASPDLSAARNRWRIASLPSHPNPHDALAPGLPRWSLELFRSRRSKPGSWVGTYDGASDRFDLSAATGDRTLGTGDGAARQRAAR